MMNDYRLYLVTDRSSLQGLNLLDVIHMAVRSGVSCVQLREKYISTTEFIALGREIKALLTPCSIPLFINDRADVALAVKADGLHLGNSDMSYEDARAILPSNMAIGLSITSLADIAVMNRYPLAYLGVSALYESSVKQDIEHYWTKSELRQLKRMTHHMLIGIGGINEKNAIDVLESGLDGVAVSSALCGRPSLSLVKETTHKLINCIYAYDKRKQVEEVL